MNSLPTTTRPSLPTTTRPSALRSVLVFLRRTFQDPTAGPHQQELHQAQRDIILSRTVVLIWISVFVMPSTIWLYIAFANPSRLLDAVWIVLAAIGAVLLLRTLVKAGLFNRVYHLSMVILVGGVFGPTGSAIVEITKDSGGDFFFAFFLIYFAFTSLYPASARWVLATSGAVIASFVGSRLLLRPEGLLADQRFVENVLYLFQLTFIGLVLNRVIVKLFFDERRARAELRHARDALLAEMEVAKHIQRLLLPREPHLREHSVHGVMLPADEVGGDYYDVIETDERRQFVAVGDVSGHGVTSGLTMMMARASLLGTLQADPEASLQTLYLALNRCLRQNLERMDLSLYMTMALFEHVGGGVFRGVGAHPPPLVYRARSRSTEEIDLSGGVWLGIVDTIPSEHIREVTVRLEEGDVLLFYTDGIVERAEEASGEMFGFERLGKTLAATGDQRPEEVLSHILLVMEDFSSIHDDDVTLLAIRHEG